MAATKPKFSLNALQPNLPDHVVAVHRFDTSYCIDVSYCSSIIRLCRCVFLSQVVTQRLES